MLRHFDGYTIWLYILHLKTHFFYVFSSPRDVEYAFGQNFDFPMTATLSHSKKLESKKREAAFEIRLQENYSHLS